MDEYGFEKFALKGIVAWDVFLAIQTFTLDGGIGHRNC
jgi:hypothetical protein